MEEKIMMSVYKPQGGVFLTTCSPDTDKTGKYINSILLIKTPLTYSFVTDIASSMDRNSPLSTSLASSESLSASLRSTELRNLHQLVETPTIEVSGGGNGISAGAVRGSANIIEGKCLPAPDLASSAMTASSTAVASAINIIASTSTAAAAAVSSTASAQAQNYESLSGKRSHIHPHVHLQQ